MPRYTGVHSRAPFRGVYSRLLTTAIVLTVTVRPVRCILPCPILTDSNSKHFYFEAVAFIV